MKSPTEDLYNLITGDEDARVCKDIPDNACSDQPHNFFAYLIANFFGKVADEIGSAKLVIPWLFGLLAVPAVFTGFLVPIREAGVLIPQLAVAAVVRNLKIRKWVWLLGAILSAFSLFGMAIAAWTMQGSSAGFTIIMMLIIFSLSRGLCSVSAKDVLGKTISKSRRGTLMGWSASLSGVVILVIGSGMVLLNPDTAGIEIFTGLLLIGGICWLIATISFATIKEQPGSTEGGGNAITVAYQQMRLVVSDRPFRRYIIASALLLSIALAPPFYVLLAQANSEIGLLGLGAFIIANGLATSLSSPFWGYMGDKSSRSVMTIAALGAGFLAILTFCAVFFKWEWLMNDIGLAIIFFILNVLHGGARLGRKVYLVDMATSENRAAYVAVSNTIIGIVMLLGGLMGLVADMIGAAGLILVLGMLSILAAVYCVNLKAVSEAEQVDNNI